MPDPVRAHGAWIFLFVSVAAGALVGARRGVEPAMLVGTGFTGAYLVAAALAMGLARRARQALVGTGLLLGAPSLALGLGAEPEFLIPASCAALVAVAAVALARRHGFLSPCAVVVGVAALALAAPTAALAGGASPARAALLFGLLWPFFSWRSLRVAAGLGAEQAWDRARLRSTGLREAALSAVWTLAVAVAL